MANITLFSVSQTYDVPADVAVDFSASHGYTAFSGNSPWQVQILVDGAVNCARGGAGAITDTPNVTGAVGQLAAGTHTFQVVWYGQSNMIINGAVLRIIATKR